MAAMDLQCRLDHGEGRWVQEEAKLLERFDAERIEWESQLRDMQKNIEELYNEVKARREGNSAGLDSSTEKSILPTTPAHPSNGYCHSPNHHSNGISHPLDHHGDAHTVALPDRHGNDSYDPAGRRSNGYSCPKQRSNGCSHAADQGSAGGRDSLEWELEDILHSCLGQGYSPCPPSSHGQNASPRAADRRQSAESGPPRHANNSSSSNERQKTAGAVNSALKDIARVSEDLCSYQDAIRKKSSDTRSEADSAWFEEEQNVKNKQSGWGSQRGDLSREMANPGVKPSSWKTEAPPIPPRITSWYPNNSPEPQLLAQESFTNRKCHSPSVLTDRKCTSPSVLRKFEAMLQENEGKILTDSGVVASVAPVDKCHSGSLHCKVGNGRSSNFAPVQKWPPESRTSAGETVECGGDCRPMDSQKFHRNHFQPMDRETVGKSTPMDFKGSPKGPWRSPAVAQKGVGQGFEGDNVRSRGVNNSYPPVQSAENSEERKPVGLSWESRFQAMDEKTFRPASPHAQSPGFWNSSREEEPNQRGYESTERFQQGQKWGPNGSGQHDDLIELLGMLGIEHQYGPAETQPQAPCQQETPQESETSCVSVKKSFSRPARPANRRPPSRWANRVPSTPVAHVTPFPGPAHKQTLSPYSYPVETVIM